MPGLQNWIHAMEEGGGAKILKSFLLVLGFVSLALAYNFLCFKNFYLPEAMDSAQLARNLSEGKGYTTDFVRPLSVHLLQQHRADHDPLLKTAHPDLANPPVYPALLAGLFKAAPMKYFIPTKTTFATYQPERWIAALNQCFFFGAALLMFFIARRLFSPTVGVISTLVLIGTELFWRFSLSGLSTMLLLVLFLGAIFCLVRMDELQREESPSLKKLIGFGILTGILIGLLGLTRYSFLWLIFPTLLFTALFAPRFRIKLSMVLLVSFLVVVAPWVARNISASGNLFGIASYSRFEQTPPFPSDTLQRTLNPDFEQVTVKNLASKLFVNARDILENRIPQLGGNWTTAFFLAGLLVSFRNPSAARLRIFLLSSLALFVVVQALGQTHLSDDSKEVSSENLLVLFAPLIFMFGTAFFLALVEQLDLTNPVLKKAAIAVYILLVSAPLVLVLLPPGERPFAYPPYHPPLIQEASSFMKENELMMSDLPWAVAWYGDRQCMALTLDRDKDFYAINDDMKRVQALYLSPQTTDARFLTQVMQPKSWEQLAFQVVARGGESTGFALKSLRTEMAPHHVFLADWERWKMPRK